jgi:hypothetical protein
MNTDVEAKKIEGNNNESNAVVKPTNPSNVRKAVSIGKEMRKQPDTSKADVARKMYESISDEPREVIVQAFIDGAGLTPKGAQTYFYNCKRRVKKSS